LIVKYPIANIVITFFGQNVRCVPGFGQAGTQPSARCTAGKLTDRLSGLHDISALVRDLLHVLLPETMADELPTTLMSRARNGFIGRYCRSVDCQYSANAKSVEELQHPPKAHAVTVFVPRQIGISGSGDPPAGGV